MSKEDSGTHTIMILLIAQFKKVPEFFLEKFNRDNFKDTTLDLLGINDSTGRNLYSVVYKKFLKKMRLDKDKYSNPRFRIKIPSSEIKANTSEMRSGITKEAKTQPEIIKEEILHEHPQLASRDEQEIDSELENFEQGSRLIPVESISIFWDGVWQLMKLKWSMIAPLTPQERESLGRMWQPFFQNYTSEKFVILGIPLIMTFGIFARKIREGRKLHKEAQDKKKKQKESDKLTKEEELRINKLTCTFCNEMFDSAHIKSHQETCKKRIRSQ